MEDKDLNTEDKILEAAAHEFIRKGRSGARMQEIANTAGINKALLHYYYRSKDLLFEAVFSLVIKRLLLNRIMAILDEEKDVFELIRRFTSLYIGVLNNNPDIPFFIIEEIQKNPQGLPKAFIKVGGEPIQRAIEAFRKASAEGIIKPLDPREIFINLISLCIFPLMGRNMMQPVLFNNNPKDYHDFLESRKKTVAEFVIESIRTNHN